MAGLDLQVDPPIDAHLLVDFKSRQTPMEIVEIVLEKLILERQLESNLKSYWSDKDILKRGNYSDSNIDAILKVSGFTVSTFVCEVKANDLSNLAGLGFCIDGVPSGEQRIKLVHILPP